MAVTPSSMLPLGTPAPAFSLPDINGDTISSESFKGYPLLVMFICNHCPYVKHVAAELARLGQDYRDEAAVVAINSNDAGTHPEDSPAKMKEEAAHRGYEFPYLYDESQQVARAYHAACTPDFFLFEKDHKLVYRGQLDDSRPGNDKPVNGHDLRAALDALKLGKPVGEDQRPSAGCNIKWKPGNEPR